MLWPAAFTWPHSSPPNGRSPIFWYQRERAIRFFGTIYFGYFDPANLTYNPNRFIAHGTSIHFLSGMAIALLSSIVFCCIGMALGSWLRTVQR